MPSFRLEVALRSVEESRPCPGLSVPVASVLNADGGLHEADQRALVRFVIQEGWGADVVFAAGTTGEWDHLPNAVCQRVVQVCTEEVAKANARRGTGDGRPVEAWAGVTAHAPADTLENVERAIRSGADAIVLAPLSIRGVSDPVRFVAREVADLLDQCTRRVPLYLYDNADIAADPKVPHIHTHQVKALSRLDFVRGIKVSARRKVLGDYIRAAATFRDRGEFGIYVGNAMLIFHIFQPRTRWLGAFSSRYQRWRLSGGLPIGVVAGPANALPREWARAWQVSRAGDGERMQHCKQVLDAYRRATQAAGGQRGIACLKRSLLAQGVVSSGAVAPGTAALSDEEAAAFDAAFAGVREMARELIGEPWVTVSPDGGEDSR